MQERNGEKLYDTHHHKTARTNANIPVHTATLAMPATGLDANIFDDNAMHLDINANLFDVGVADEDIFGLYGTHTEADIELGLGWSWMSPEENNRDAVVDEADRTTQVEPVVAPVIAKGARANGERHRC